MKIFFAVLLFATFSTTNFLHNYFDSPTKIIFTFVST